MARRWDEIGRRAPKPIGKPPEIEPPEHVLRRVFQTTDGLKALAILEAQALAPCSPNASDSALREAEGARSFVVKLVQTVQGSDDR